MKEYKVGQRNKCSYVFTVWFLMLLLLLVSPVVASAKSADKGRSDPVTQENLAGESVSISLDASNVTVITPPEKEEGVLKSPLSPNLNMGDVSVAQSSYSPFMSEGFEGIWPEGSPGWSRWGQGSNLATWDDTSYKFYSGSKSAWCADTFYDPWTQNYPNNMEGWMVYGPFSLADASDARLKFAWWSISETNYYDWVGVYASRDGTSFYSPTLTSPPPWSGNWGYWKETTYSLKNWGSLGDLTGDSSVWIAFIFKSDSSNTYKGAFVDDVLLGGPDLIKTYFDAPSSAFPGDTISVTDTVKNNGNVASGAFRQGVYLSTDSVITPSVDRYIGSSSVASLAAGMSSTGTYPVPIPGDVAPGSYYIGTYADDQFVVGEVHEANNYLVKPTPIVIGGPDLIKTYFDAPSSAFPGDTISVTDTVKNNGNVASGAFRQGVYLSTDSVITPSVDRYIGSSSVASLAAGMSSTGTYPVPIPGDVAPGSYYIGTYADDQFVVRELNETNNYLTRYPITITPVDVSNLSYSPHPYDPTGGSVTISYSLNKSAFTYLIVLDLSGNQVRLAGPYSGVAGANSLTWNGRNQAGSLVAASWYVYVVYALDGTSSDYAYDLMWVSYGSALTISNLSASPNPFNPSAGQSTTISATFSRTAYGGVNIYSSTGTLVKSDPEPGFKNPGANTFIWDGRNDAGATVPNGIYYYLVWGVDSGSNVTYQVGAVTVQ